MQGEALDFRAIPDYARNGDCTQVSGFEPGETPQGFSALFYGFYERSFYFSGFSGHFQAHSCLKIIITKNQDWFSKPYLE
jgi:hypothetical protein